MQKKPEKKPERQRQRAFRVSSAYYFTFNPIDVCISLRPL